MTRLWWRRLMLWLLPPKRVSVSVWRRPGESDEDFMARVDEIAARGPGHE